MRARWLAGLMGAAGLAYGVAFVHPGVLFAGPLTYGTFRVYSTQPVGDEMKAVLDTAEAKLSASPIYGRGAIHPLFLTGGGWRLKALAPFSAEAFGVTYAWPGYTLLNRADPRSDRIYRPGGWTRPLSAVVAHERTHQLLADRYGFFTVAGAPRWKVEGYCEYVAGGLSLDAGVGKRRVSLGENSKELDYFRGYLIVKYLIEVERLSVDALMRDTLDPDRVMRQVRAHLDAL